MPSFGEEVRWVVEAALIVTAGIILVLMASSPFI